MKIIALCGSLKFSKEMMEIAEKLELDGNCAITPIYPRKENKDNYKKKEFKIFEKMHQKK